MLRRFELVYCQFFIATEALLTFAFASIVNKICLHYFIERIHDAFVGCAEFNDVHQKRVFKTI